MTVRLENGISIPVGDTRYLKLDQTAPQNITGGQPDFNAGLRAGSTDQLSIDASGNITTTGYVVGSANTDTLECSGFTAAGVAASTLSWVDGALGATRTFTITGAHDIYINGVKSTKPTASIQIADTTGTHWIYYDAAGTLSESTTVPTFNLPQIATVYWNTTVGFDKGILGGERHGITMDWKTHQLLHDTVGTRYASGLTGTFTDTTFSLSASAGVPASWFDEDIKYSYTSPLTTCDVFYKNGAADYEWITNQTVYYYTSGGNLYWNNGNTLTAAGANKYVAVWIFATNNNDRPIVALIGQNVSDTIAAARSVNTYEGLTLGNLPYREMKLLYRVILRNDVTPFEEIQDYRNVSNLPTGTYIASSHALLTGLSADDHTQYWLAGAVGRTDNFLTTGTLGAGAITGTSFIIGANTLTTSEWAYLDGIDQALKTSNSPTFNQGNFTTLHTTTLLSDHIGEHVGAHTVTFDNNLTVSAKNIITDTVTGTQIGTGTTQKLGFFGATTVVQQLAATDLGTALSNLGLRAAGTAYPLATTAIVKFDHIAEQTAAHTITLDNTCTSLTILPAADSTSDLGSSAPKYFANAYLDKVFLNSTATLDGASAGVITGTGAFTTTLDIGLVATKKIYFDGVARTGDTYIYESGANVLDFYAGGANTLKLNATTAAITGAGTVSTTLTVGGTTSIRPFTSITNGISGGFYSGGTAQNNGIYFNTPLGSAQQIIGDYYGTGVQQALSVGVYDHISDQMICNTDGSVTFGHNIKVGTTGNVTDYGYIYSADDADTYIRLFHQTAIGDSGSIDLFVDAVNYLAVTSTSVTLSTLLHVNDASVLSDNTAIDPDSYTNSTVSGLVADGSGFSAVGIGGKASGTGDTWAIVRTTAQLVLATGDGTNANSLLNAITIDNSQGTTFYGNLFLTNGKSVTGGVFTVSKAITVPTSATTLIYTTVDGEIVVDAYFEVTTAWDGTGTVTVGDAGDTDGFLTDANINQGALGWYGYLCNNSAVEGARGVYLGGSSAFDTWPRRKIYTAAAAGAINITTVKGTSTVGAGTAYIVLQRLK
jgi:hypothetical protein